MLKKKTPKELALAKLKESNLDAKDLKRFGFEILSATQTNKIFPKQKAASLKLNYYDLDGKQRKEIFRVRLLEVVPDDFGGIPEKPLRYLQPHETPPAAYFPKTISWREVASDKHQTIIITEGELKAACAAKHGFTCIGLGGVFSWRSKREGWSLLPELQEINWYQRDVVIVFDSDAATNPQVRAAIGMLSNELAQRGAIPRVAELPKVGEGKTGLDDYIVAKGAESFRMILEVAESDELHRRLWEFNSRFVFVRFPGFVLEEEKDLKYKPNDFKFSIFANEWATKEENDKIVRTPVARSWLEWPMRRQVDSLAYEPGKDKLITDHRGRTSLNCWSGWAVEPKKGDVAPWKWLLDFLFTGSDKVSRQWFENWCLYPIRYPGVKMLTAAVVWSLYMGNGKSSVGFTLKEIYGENYNLIEQGDLDDQFNGWCVHKQFVMVDDVSAHETRAKADRLKKIITQPTAQINIKFIPSYELRDCCNYYLTSNRANAFYIEEGDRRFFIHEVTEKMRPLKEYKAYMKWLKEQGGAQALLYYAQNEHDFSGFDPDAPPPKTKAKEEMINTSRGELSLWLSSLRDDPDGHLRKGSFKFKRDLFTPSELVWLFNFVRVGRPVPPNVMGIFLKEYFKPAAGGSTLRAGDVSERFYIIRNHHKWRKAPRRSLLSHINKERKEEQGKGVRF